MNDFHFLRPEWFLALLPAALVVWITWTKAVSSQGKDWAGLIDSHLLQHLTVSGRAVSRPRGLLAALVAGLFASILALAGPTWEKLPVPTTAGGTPMVAVLSLAQSMNGNDLVPSRLARAGHKLHDILDRSAGEDVGLVIYADRPFVAAPLTPDSSIVREMLPELSTNLMPVLGNRLDLAIAKAQDLLTSSGAARGRILVMADDLGLDPEASRSAAERVKAAGYELDILGVGSENGAALQTADGRAIRVGGQDAPIAKLDPKALSLLAGAGGGRYAAITADGSDLDHLLPRARVSTTSGKASAIKADRWRDRGYLFVLVPVLLLPLAFRRGVVFALAISLFGFASAPGAQAAGWDGLWATPDQQGARDFAAEDYASASQAFEAPDWKAAALYRDGDYAAAAAGYGSGYNEGNALAKAGRLEEALASYDAHLALAPDDADAQFNRDLVAQLLEKQKQDTQQDQQQEHGSGDQQEQQDQQQSASDSQQQHSGQQTQQNQQSGDPGQTQQDQHSAQGDAGSQSTPAQQAEGASEDMAGQQQDQQSTPDNGNGNGNGQQQKDSPSQGQQSAEGQNAQQRGAQSGQMQSAQMQTDPSASESGQDAESRDPSNNHGQQASEMAQAGEASQTPKASGSDSDEEGTLSRLIDQLLQGNGTAADDQAEPTAQVAAAGPSLDQAAEQQLRAVPDDPSGLLRARIRQHYAQLRANGQ